MEKLTIEYWPISKITPYARNAKMHPAHQIEQIKKSINEFGFRDPIAVWHGEIVEGHGRLIAAKELKMSEVPVIVLDDLTDEQRRAYALVHNKLTMNSDFDLELLDMELGDIADIDMGDFGFEFYEMEEFDESDLDAVDERESVVVSINCGAMEKYEEIKDRLQALADEIGGSLAVKMA